METCDSEFDDWCEMFETQRSTGSCPSKIEVIDKMGANSESISAGPGEEKVWDVHRGGRVVP
jgi:hypothetical protein